VQAVDFRAWQNFGEAQPVNPSESAIFVEVCLSHCLSLGCDWTTDGSTLAARRNKRPGFESVGLARGDVRARFPPAFLDSSFP
jgi:hypothetical protein